MKMCATCVINVMQLKTENIEMESLFRSEAQALHNQLILHYSASPDQVFKCGVLVFMLSGSQNCCILV